MKEKKAEGGGKRKKNANVVYLEMLAWLCTTTQKFFKGSTEGLVKTSLKF